MLFGRKKEADGLDWLVVGLGNPGAQYERTRHNVGFLVLDELGRRGGCSIQKLKYKALTDKAQIGGARALLMKPMTFMNLSGEAVGQAAAFYHLPAERVLVVSDDASLPVGKLRVRRSGSAGGHNGLKSIIAHLGGDQFPRVKVGVGAKPHPDYDMADWVLSKFSAGEETAIQTAAALAADAVECILRQGVEAAMGAFNG